MFVWWNKYCDCCSKRNHCSFEKLRWKPICGKNGWNKIRRGYVRRKLSQGWAPTTPTTTISFLPTPSTPSPTTTVTGCVMSKWPTCSVSLWRSWRWLWWCLRWVFTTTCCMQYSAEITKLLPVYYFDYNVMHACFTLITLLSVQIFI